jgi:hypothetical protein
MSDHGIKNEKKVKFEEEDFKQLGTKIPNEKKVKFEEEEFKHKEFKGEKDKNNECPVLKEIDKSGNLQHKMEKTASTCPLKEQEVGYEALSKVRKLIAEDYNKEQEALMTCPHKIEKCSCKENCICKKKECKEEGIWDKTKEMVSEGVEKATELAKGAVTKTKEMIAKF